MATVSIILDDCLKELADIVSSRVQRYESEVSQSRWLDELGRLRIWAGNTGALQCDQLSLDYRLRDASHLKSEISRILQRVLQVVRSLSDLLDEPEEETSGDESFLDLAGELLDEEDLMTDVQMLHQSLHNAISLLNQLSLETRKPADHDLLLSVNVKDVSLPEPWAQQYVSQDFPGLDEATVHRLSAAMTKQRAVFQYRSQKPRLSGEIEDSKSTLPERGAAVNSQASDSDQLQSLEMSTSELFQTPCPTSAFTDHESVSIPSPPESSTNNCPFECPYCGSLMTIKCAKDWTLHIFEDLMPYTCLSADCITPFKLYESRSQWYHHMCEAHSVPSNDNGFTCPLCNNAFEPPITFERHVGEHLEQLALFVLRTGSEHISPLAASHTTTPLKVFIDPTLSSSELGTQNISNDRLAAETTNVGSAARVSHEATHQCGVPFDNMTPSQVPDLPIDDDRNLFLSPKLCSQAGQEIVSPELQEDADPLSPVGSLSPIDLVSPVDSDRKSDCSPVPSSEQRFDRQAAFDRLFSDLVHNLPQASTERHAGSSEPPETNRESPIYEQGHKYTQDLSEAQSPTSDDRGFHWKLQGSREDPSRSDEKGAMPISTSFSSPDLSGRKLSLPEKDKLTKSLASVLPMYHDYTSDQLNEERDEYIQTKFDDVGETKVDFLGYLRHNREYICQAFRLPYRGKKLFMLSAECAEALNYRSMSLFTKYRSLHQMVATSIEKETMMERLLPFGRQHSEVTFVSARSIFLQFGCRIIVNGRQFRDDYWESRIREEGYTEDDVRNEQQPSLAEPMTGLVVSEEKRVCQNCGTRYTAHVICSSCWSYLELHGEHRQTDLQQNAGSGGGGSAHAYPTSYDPYMSDSSPMPSSYHAPASYSMPAPYYTPDHPPMPSPYAPPGPYLMPGLSSLHRPQNTSWSDTHIYDEGASRNQPEDDPAQWEVSRRDGNRQERHQKSRDSNPDDSERLPPGNQTLAYGLPTTGQKKLQESIESRSSTDKPLDSLYASPPKSLRKKGKLADEDALAQEEGITLANEYDRSKPVWFKVDKRAVDAQILKMAGERFEEHDTYFLIPRGLSRDKIQEYIRKTKEYRALNNPTFVERKARGTHY